jgi:Fe-S-cluster containining protein
MRLFPEDSDARYLRVLRIHGSTEHEVTGMSACDTCAKPGACCNDFVLNGRRGGLRVAEENWQVEAEERMEWNGLPFKPLRIDADDANPVEGMVLVRFTCPKVTPEGRCSIYETRPQLCRDYQAGEDKLCVMYVEAAQP